MINVHKYLTQVTWNTCDRTNIPKQQIKSSKKKMEGEYRAKKNRSLAAS